MLIIRLWQILGQAEEEGKKKEDTFYIEAILGSFCLGCILFSRKKGLAMS
jgi:hypothetical protein